MFQNFKRTKLSLILTGFFIGTYSYAGGFLEPSQVGWPELMPFECQVELRGQLSDRLSMISDSLTPKEEILLALAENWKANPLSPVATFENCSSGEYTALEVDKNYCTIIQYQHSKEALQCLNK